jgi:signal transduction histidine kinase
MKIKKKFLKQFIEMSDSPLFSRKTVVGLLRSILEPIAGNNPPALIFTRLLQKEGIEGVIRRLEYCQNVEMYNYKDVAKNDDLVELEFILVTSARFSALLMWDFSAGSDKTATQIYFLLNSAVINEMFELMQDGLKKDFRDKFYEFKPERRDNSLMNSAVFKILEILNENIMEQEFQESEIGHSVSQQEFSQYRDSVTKNIREISHEINNQLSVLNIHAKLLEKEFGQSKKISVIKKVSELVTSLLGEMMGISDTNLENQSLYRAVSRAVTMVTPIAKERGNEIVFKGSEMKAAINEDKYISALINILKNASENSENDKIEVELTADGPFAKLSITNHGAPIADAKKIFNSGYSTKGTAGVGLVMSKRYLEVQLSMLELTKSDEDGTCFTITTPLAM